MFHSFIQVPAQVKEIWVFSIPLLNAAIPGHLSGNSANLGKIWSNPGHWALGWDGNPGGWRHIQQMHHPDFKTSNNFYFLKTLTDNSFRGDNFPIDQGLYFNLVPSLNVCQGSFPVVRTILAGGEAGGAGIVWCQQETDCHPQHGTDCPQHGAFFLRCSDLKVKGFLHKIIWTVQTIVDRK